MALIQVTAFITGVLLLAYLFRESFVSVLPCAVCILVLLLYVLALCGHLSLIDYLGIGLLSGAGVCLFTNRRRDILGHLRQTVMEPSFAASVILLCVVTLCVFDKTASWWDDINFWATDVKSLYYLDGFARRYGNVAPEFGDYPPAAQLFKWWFLHLDRHTFREGLAFAGYHVMNLAFLSPLLQRKNKANIAETSFIMFLLATALWLFPGIAEIYGYHGFCADLTMACIYGNFLFAVTDRDGHRESFYRARLILYLSVLVLVKSVGFIWVAFGLAFFILYRKASDLKLIGLVTAAPLLSGASWMLFCLLMRRVTKTTATAVKYLTTDEYTWSLYRREFTQAFVRALFTEPLHKGRTWALDLSPFGFYLLLIALIIFFCRACLIPKKQGLLILWFSVLSGAVMYAIIYLSHLTIFANETQYLEPAAMVSSIERYGAPFTVGTLLFLSLLWMARGDALFARPIPPGKNALSLRLRSFFAAHGTVLCFVLLVVLTTAWKDGYDGLIGYRGRTAEVMQEREQMTDDRSRTLLEALRPLGTKESTRVLCLQNDVSERWVRNSYTNFAAAPVSIVYMHADVSALSGDSLTDMIRSAHAAYLYTDQADAETDLLFSDMTKDETFKRQTLYRIEDDGARVSLAAVAERYGD